MSEMSLRAGDTLSWTITIPEAADLDSIAGATPACRLSGPGGDLPLTCVVISVADRRVGAFARASETARLLPGYYRYELVLHWPGGVRRSSLSGAAQVVGGAGGV